MTKQESHVDYFKAHQKALSEIINISNKYPKYIKHLVNIYMKEPFNDGALEMVKTIYKRQIEYNQVFKNEYFSLLKYDNIELIEDLMQSTLMKHNAKKLANSLVSKKHHKLLSPEVYILFVYFVEKNFSKSMLQKLIGEKVARFKNSIDFEQFVKSVILSVDKINMISIEEKAKNLNVFIISKNNNKLILQVMDYESSKILGSPSWCISYKEEYWNQYNKNYSIMSLIGISETNQYFVWDFNKEPYDNEFLIGITVKKGRVVAAHYKDDSAMDKNKTEKEYNYLLKKDLVSYEELLRRVNKLEIKEFLKKSMIDHINRSYGIKR